MTPQENGFIGRAQQRIIDEGQRLAEHVYAGADDRKILQRMLELYHAADLIHSVFVSDDSEASRSRRQRIMGVLGDRYDLYRIPFAAFLGYDTGFVGGDQRPGIRGEKGSKGDKGNDGRFPTLDIGTIEDGLTAQADVDNTDPLNPLLNLVLPRGKDGEPLPIRIGTVTAGETFSANLRLFGNEYYLDLTLIPGPAGEDGLNGISGYLYTAYADDENGSGFSTTDNGQHWAALITSEFPLVSLDVFTFSGHWYRRVPGFRVGDITPGPDWDFTLNYDPISKVWIMDIVTPDSTDTDCVCLSQEDYNKLMKLIFTPPTLNHDPIKVATLEVGAEYENNNLSIQVTVTNIDSVLDDELYYRRYNPATGALDNEQVRQVTSLKQEIFNITGITRLTETDVNILYSRIRREDNQQAITRTSYIAMRYRAFWFIHPAADNLFLKSDGQINTRLNNVRSNPLTGEQGSILDWDEKNVNLDLNPSDTSQLQHLYIATPTNFGSVEVANQQVGYNNPMLLDSHTFSLDFGAASSPYTLYKVYNDAFAGPIKLMFRS